ncbi:MAG: D-aminoacyl-tRNA deacylase [Bacilli bacterium]
MKVLVQRVIKASVEVEQKTVGSINKGLLLFVGFTKGDDINIIDSLINKILNLRIFDDENGVMNLSVLDVKKEILSISQFTLYANTKKGNRPSYIEALKGEEATLLYDLFNERLSKFIKVEKGIFGADMKVSLINDGPITIMLEK